MENFDLVSSWQSLAQQPAPRTIAPVNLYGKRTRSLSQRLMHSYIGGGVVAVVASLLAFELNVIFPHRLWLAISYAVVMVIVGLLNIAIGVSIHRAKIITLPVAQALGHVVALKRRIVYTKIVANIMSTPVAVLLFVEAWHSGIDAIFIGAVTGGIVGLILGTLMTLRNFRRLKQLQAALSNH